MSKTSDSLTGGQFGTNLEMLKKLQEAGLTPEHQSDRRFMNEVYDLIARRSLYSSAEDQVKMYRWWIDTVWKNEKGMGEKLEAAIASMPNFIKHFSFSKVHGVLYLPCLFYEWPSPAETFRKNCDAAESVLKSCDDISSREVGLFAAPNAKKRPLGFRWEVLCVQYGSVPAEGVYPVADRLDHGCPVENWFEKMWLPDHRKRYLGQEISILPVLHPRWYESFSSSGGAAHMDSGKYYVHLLALDLVAKSAKKDPRVVEILRMSWNNYLTATSATHESKYSLADDLGVAWFIDVA